MRISEMAMIVRGLAELAFDELGKLRNFDSSVVVNTGFAKTRIGQNWY